MSDGTRINMDDVQRSMAAQRDRAAMSEAAKEKACGPDAAEGGS